MRKIAKITQNYFPAIARGHSLNRMNDARPCCKPGTKDAHYDKNGNYIDGHYASQATTQERAHAEGYR